MLLQRSRYKQNLNTGFYAVFPQTPPHYNTRICKNSLFRQDWILSVYTKGQTNRTKGKYKKVKSRYYKVAFSGHFPATNSWFTFRTATWTAENRTPKDALAHYEWCIPCPVDPNFYPGQDLPPIQENPHRWMSTTPNNKANLEKSSPPVGTRDSL